jgi:hypothetical protein
MQETPLTPRSSAVPQFVKRTERLRGSLATVPKKLIRPKSAMYSAPVVHYEEEFVPCMNALFDPLPRDVIVKSSLTHYCTPRLLQRWQRKN